MLHSVGVAAMDLGRAALDLLLPATCGVCGVEVATAHALCPACWRGVSFLSPPWCARCGLPFDPDVPEGAECAGCLARPPAYDRLRTATAYGAATRRLVMGLKHGDRHEVAPLLAGWMLAGCGEAIDGCEVVVPVPLHWRRLVARRFNQSALLARLLARRAGLVHLPDAMARTRHTPMQRGRSAAGRRRNVAGAFAVRPRSRHRIDGRRVLLVDDVMTTGATLEACAGALRRAGAAGVHAVAVARVVREDPATI